MEGAQWGRSDGSEGRQHVSLAWKKALKIVIIIFFESGLILKEIQIGLFPNFTWQHVPMISPDLSKCTFEGWP